MNTVRWYFFALLLLGMGLLIYGVYRYRGQRKDKYDMSLVTAQNSLRFFTQTIQNFTHQAKMAMQEFAQNNLIHKNKDERVAFLKKLLNQENLFSGAGIIIAPDDRMQGYDGIYAYRLGDVLSATMVTKEVVSMAWYIQAMSGTSGVWSEPFVEPKTKQNVIRYSLPVAMLGEGEIKRFLIFCDIPIVRINEVLSGSSALGYNFAVTKGGYVVVHSNSDFTNALSTFNQFIATQEHQSLWEGIAYQSHRGERVVRLIPQNNEAPLLVVTEPIGQTGWFTGLATPLTPTRDLNSSMYHMQLLMLIALLIIVIALLFFLLQLGGYQLWKLWFFAFLVTIFLLSAVPFILYLNYAFDDVYVLAESERSVPNKEALAHIIGVDKKLRKDAEYIRYIPTSISVYYFDFSKANMCEIHGYIAQLYPSDVDKDEKNIGVHLLEANQADFKEVHRKINEDGTILIVWSFNASFSPRLSFLRYPFDQHRITLKFVPNDFTSILVPNFSPIPLSYEINGFSSLRQSEWNITKTFFSYMMSHENKDYSTPMKLPELQFNIIISRNILYPLLSGILPIMIVFAVLFIILFSMSIDANVLLSTRMGLVTALLFSAVISHQKLISMLQGGGYITYLESYYFIFYAFIVLVSTNIFVAYLNKDLFIIAYEENLISRALYWPLVSLCIMITTIIFFY